MKNSYRYLALVLFLVTSVSAQGQKQGGYRSAGEFLNNTPKYASDFKVEKRSHSSILLWGGNDYEVEGTDKPVTSSVIKKELWGVYSQDTLYVNAKPLTNYNGYCKAIVVGKYCLVKPAFPTRPSIVDEYGLRDIPQYSYLFSGIGGGIKGGQLAVARIPIVYNLQTGEKKLLSKDTMLTLLQGHTDIKARYEAEADMESEEVLIKYLTLLNTAEKL